MRSSSAAESRSPFFVAEARQAGLTWKELQTKRWTRLSRGQYVRSDVPQDVFLKLRAAERRLPREAVFSGLTAAWLWGLDVTPCEPIEATVDREIAVRGRSGMRVRRASISGSDVTTRRGFRTTTVLRTVCDLGSRRDLVESVVVLDMALHADVISVAELSCEVGERVGAKGVKRLRRAVALADARAESPMETRLRLELLKARLPRPCLQKEIHDPSGTFIGRVDLYYPDRKLVIEYDGESHRDRLVTDLRRQNALINAGYHVLRFTAADLRVSGSVASQVRLSRQLLNNKRR